MELKEFVTETISQIMDGISDAQKKAAEIGGIVNPMNITNFPEKVPHVAIRENGQIIRQKIDVIDFEVVLTEVETQEHKTGIGVALANVLFGNENKKEAEAASLNKVRFSVTISFPYQRHPY